MVQEGASSFSEEFGLISRNPFGERMTHVAIEERGEELGVVRRVPGRRDRGWTGGRTDGGADVTK